MSWKEAQRLRKFASRGGGGCLVSAESSPSKPAVALATGAKTASEHASVAACCVEPHEPFSRYDGDMFGPKDRSVFYEVMLENGSYGTHHYAGVARDCRYWSQDVLHASIVALADATNPECEPQRLPTELQADGHIVQFPRVGRIAAPAHLQTAKSLLRPTDGAQRLLVACDHLVLSGGLLRMERVAERLSAWGHDVAFLAFNRGKGADFPSGFEVFGFDSAAEQLWNAVLVPGAGFPEDTIRHFAWLRAPQFGTRVQLVLNDRSRREGFLAVNRSFAPAVVIFNSRAWPPGTFTDFAADRFHVLEGAVDTGAFRPRPYRTFSSADDVFVIGGRVNRNPRPLLDALRLLPERIKLRLFGRDVLSLASSERDLVSRGRLELTGVLHGQDLGAFYDGVDMVCMTETGAGWSNLVAEAMASGLPVVCTPHGTAAIAHDGFTALVVRHADARQLAISIASLASDPGLCERLGRNARLAIEPYDWDSYARQLLRLTRPDSRSDYYHAPELGFHGKWPVADRMDGLQELLAVCRGKSVLDLGAAEGAVSLRFLEAGAAPVHGFELNPSRVQGARTTCSAYEEVVFEVGDLSHWDKFVSNSGPHLLARYDLVLYLGVHHHLPREARLSTLCGALDRTTGVVVIRMPMATWEDDRLTAFFDDSDFDLKHIETASRTGQGRLVFCTRRSES